MYIQFTHPAQHFLNLAQHFLILAQHFLHFCILHSLYFLYIRYTIVVLKILTSFKTRVFIITHNLPSNEHCSLYI
jgi:hypothetical protein